MRVLCIHGSPRSNGNSSRLLDQVISGAEAQGAAVSSIRASELHIAGCLSCGGCSRSGVCVVQDDMQRLYALLDEATAVVLATPVYFYGVPAQLKCLIDRAQACWSRRQILKSREERKRYDRGSGYLIAVAATRGEKVFLGVELTARYFFDALDLAYAGSLLVREADQPDAVLGRPDELQAAFDLGMRLARPTTI